MPTSKRMITTQRISRMTALAVAVICVSVSLMTVPVRALTTDQRKLYNSNILFYDINGRNNCSTDTSGQTDIVTDADQEAIAKIIIGTAKTLNLGEKGAIIGVMTAITESGLKIYANSNVPLSLKLNHQAVGSDHDSLGIMQQRISTDWSTISSSPTDKDAVTQLMDPAYNAQAFFGAPPGTKDAPRQLSKGLQQVNNWESLQPWIAAQKVQISAFSDGSNYRSHYDEAVNMVHKYYDSAAAVVLPVTLDGGTSTGSGQDASTCTGLSLGTGTGKFVDGGDQIPDAAKAVARAKLLADNSSDLYKATCGTHRNCAGYCDYLAGVVWGYANSGYASALVHWQSMVDKGFAHPGDRNPPVGAQLFYYTATFGHIATYLGNNLVLTNDNDGKASTPGGAYIVSASAIETGPWRLPYLGWSYGTPPFAGGKLTGSLAF